MQPEFFPPGAERIVAEVAIDFWKKHNEPVSQLLTFDAEQKLNGHHGEGEKKKLKDLISLIQTGKLEPVPVKALQDRLYDLRKSAFYNKAIDEILTASEKDELTPELLAEVVEKANKELKREQAMAHDYLSRVETRIKRRLSSSQERSRYPLLFVDPLDEKIRMIGRGQMGLLIAPYKSGKGMAFIHIAGAYAMQGLNVLYFTLEDPLNEVEDRLDASLTGIPTKKLQSLPNRFKKRFNAICKKVRGCIHIIDGTDGGWTIAKIERVYEEEKANGFIADAILIDYDDELESPKAFKGESARRMEFGLLYRLMRQMASRLNVILWTASQSDAGSEGQRIVSGRNSAEDKGKVRKVGLAIGIGQDPDNAHVKHLYVAAHKTDRSRFGVDICTNFASAIFYDREETLRMQRKTRK